jgi:AraC-like DNA-binding protein
MARRFRNVSLLRQTATHSLGRLTFAEYNLNYRPHGPMPLRFWDTFAAVYVLAGRAQYHDVNGLSLPLRPGDLLLMFPGHGYRYEIDPSRPWSELSMHFQGAIFDLLRRHQVLDPNHPIYHLTPIEKWRQRFEDVVRRRPGRRTGDALNQVCRFLNLLTEALSKGRRRKHHRPQSLWLAQATELLDRQPVADPPDWSAISRQMGLSYERFRKRFTQLADVSPGRYLMARRMETACTMLQDRDLGLKEIARACGFCDVFQFSKRFKHSLRLTPTEYRQYKLHDP